MKKIFTFLFVLAVFSMQAQYMTEDFESGIPADWSTTSDSWVLTNSAAITTQYFNVPEHTEFMGFNDDALGGDSTADAGFVITAPVDLSAATSPAVLFSAFFGNGDYGADERATVSVSTDGGATWTEVFSIEEGDFTGWQDVAVPVVDYAGMTVQFAFGFDDGGGWNYGFCFDDVSVDEYVAPADDVVFRGFYQGCMSADAGKDAYFNGTLVNKGTNVLNSVDLNYTDGTNTVTESLTGLNLAFNESYQFVHPTPHSIGLGANNMEFTITNPNGVADENPGDNNFSFTITGVETEAGQAVVVEEATGTWCQWCPRGTVFLDMMSKCFDDFVGIAVHNGDPMVNTAYDGAITGLPGFSGFPSVYFNRNNIIDPGDIVGPSVSIMQTAPTVSLGVNTNWDAATRVITPTVYADFASAPGAGTKWVAVLVEDNLSGTSSDWNQSNAYSGNEFELGAMGNFEALPGSVPASMLVYDHVGRELLTAFAGVSDANVDAATAGSSVSYTFDAFTLPNGYNEEECHVVVMLLGANGQVINAKSVDVTATTGVNPQPLVDAKVRVFPNPTEDVANIRLTLERPMDVTIAVYNTMGQEVARRNYGTMIGDEIVPMNVTEFASGNYFVRIALDDQVITKQITVK